MRIVRAIWLSALLSLVLVPLDALAHKSSDAFLRLQVEGTEIRGSWDVALRDLALVLALDDDADGSITWGELRRRHAELASFALARLELARAGKACPARATGHKVARHSDGAYAVIEIVAECPRAEGPLSVGYALFAAEDAQHRGLLSLTADGLNHAAVLRNDGPARRFEPGAPSRVAATWQYLGEGAWHIWIGFDHVLFLATLLLPAVLVRREGEWHARESMRSAAIDALWVVTAFTLAHSATLAAAALGWVSLPGRLVESAIALSVILAALNNVHPVISGRRWLMAFVFGLVHGLGFASALENLGLPQGAFVLALVAFNLGVEIGQVVVVLALLPLAYRLRAGAFYRKGVMVAGSFAIAAIAGVWLAQRALDLR